MELRVINFGIDSLATEGVLKAGNIFVRGMWTDEDFFQACAYRLEGDKTLTELEWTELEETEELTLKEALDGAVEFMDLGEHFNQEQVFLIDPEDFEELLYSNGL